MDGFNSILEIGKEEEVKMILERKGRDSKKIGQILLHWCYELN